MDFLNKATAQLRGLLLSLPPGTRITTGLLLAVIVVSLVALFQWQAAGPDAYLMGGEPFSSDQLMVMETAFSKAGLGEYQIEGSRIRVPRGQHASYMGALADGAALPKSFSAYLDEAISQDGVLATKHDKQQRMLVARQKELNLILRNMEGFRAASVLFDRQKGKGLALRDVVTASVSVQTITGSPIDPRRIPSIKRLVAGSFAGLRPEDVTVADLNGPVYAGSGDDAMSSALEDPYYARTALVEETLEKKIRQHLVNIPGVQVHVSAELDKEVRREEERIEVDPNKTTPLQLHTRKTMRTDQGASSGGRPGLEAQGPGGGPLSLANRRGPESEEETRDEQIHNVVPTQQISIEFQGLTPTQVRVSIVVPSDYYFQVWSEKHRNGDGTPPTQEQLDILEADVRKNVANSVLPLLPSIPDEVDPLSRVIVTTFQSLRPDPIASPTLSEETFVWAGQYAGTLTMAGLALFALAMLRSMVRSIPPTEAGPGQSPVPLSIADETVGPAAEGQQSGGGAGRRFQQTPSSRDELAEMVREDPDAAASILRTWIANAG